MTIALTILMALVVLYSYRWVKPRRRNRLVRRKSRPDVRVPRETSWSRANRIYGDTQ
jgi:hypothetical protein